VPLTLPEYNAPGLPYVLLYERRPQAPAGTASLERPPSGLFPVAVPGNPTRMPAHAPPSGPAAPAQVQGTHSVYPAAPTRKRVAEPGNIPARRLRRR
jgi:hypothetical protein